MKAYVLVNPNNNRLVDNKIPTYPSILPEYDIIYGPTVDTVGEVPEWYIDYVGCKNKERIKRGYCTYLGHMQAIYSHYCKYPDEDLLIMEDDVEFIDDFDTCYKNFMKMVPSNWDAIYFGGWYRRGFPAECVPNVLNPCSACVLVGAECILINAKLVKLISSYFRNTPTEPRVQFDSTLNSWCRNGIITRYSPVTMFAHQKRSFSSIENRVIDRDSRNSSILYANLKNELVCSTVEDLKRYK